MLDAWTTILQEFAQSYLENKFSECAKQVFNKYIQCHLAPPDGCRKNNGEVEDIEDNEDNDRSKFKDQLQVIGMFGRVVPGHALPVLFKLVFLFINIEF